MTADLDAYDVKTAAARVCMSTDAIQNAITNGYLAAYQPPVGKNGEPSRKWLIFPADLADWIRKGARS